jgi:hypothetical protein
MGNGQTDDENWKLLITFVGKFKSMILSTDINF